MNGSDKALRGMKPLKYFSLLILTTLIMGTSFPVGKTAMLYAPPFLLMGLRYVIAGVLLAVIVRKRPLPKGRRQWARVAVIGFFQTAGVMGCAYYSMKWLTSGESAILTFTSPLLVIVLSAVLEGAAYRLSQWGGVLLGLLGIAACFGFQMSFSPGTAIGFAGAVSFAISTLLVKWWGGEHDAFVLTAYQMLAGGAMLLLLSLGTEKGHFFVSAASIGTLLWLVLVCSILQFSIWFYLLLNGDPAKTSSFLFLAPLFGVLSSRIMLGEAIHGMMALGAAGIFIGIYFVNRRPLRSPTEFIESETMHGKENANSLTP